MKKILKYIVLTVITWQARLVLKKYKPTIVAITGSVGKTSTKDMVHDVLHESFFVRKSTKSYNSDLGVPLAILGAETGWGSVTAWLRVILEGCILILFKNHYPKMLVLEVGVDVPGSIQRITKWLKPDAVVVTKMADVPVHVEFFGSPEKLMREKAYLVEAVKEGGFVVLNEDDHIGYEYFKKFTEERIFTYGTSDRVFMRGMYMQPRYNNDNMPTGMTFKLFSEGNTIPVVINGVLGEQYMYTALAALCVASGFDMNVLSAVEAVATYNAPAGRSRIIEGLHHTMIIDDSYNASPVALEQSLFTLGQIETHGKRIAVIGDMKELGTYADAEHKRIGEYAAKKCDMLVAVGEQRALLVEGALAGGLSEKNIRDFEHAQEAGKFVEHQLAPGDVVLVKGSQSVRLERAVLEIMAHPEDRFRLLARQEREWLNR